MHGRPRARRKQMPLGRDRVGFEASRIVEGEFENVFKQRRSRGVAEDEHVVGLDVNTAKAEVGRAEENLDRLAVAFGDQHLVVLQAREMHPPSRCPRRPTV